MTVTLTGGRTAEESSRVEVVHDRWERHGDAAQEYRDSFAGAWDVALARFADLSTDGQTGE